METTALKYSTDFRKVTKETGTYSHIRERISNVTSSCKKRNETLFYENRLTENVTAKEFDTDAGFDKLGDQLPSSAAQ
jgi:hypothetical protein